MGCATRAWIVHEPRGSPGEDHHAVKVDPACYPCALRRILSSATHITDDQWLHHKLIVKAMSDLAEMERDVTPAEMMLHLESLLCSTLGVTDPYQKVRGEWNQEMAEHAAEIGDWVRRAKDPLQAALCLAGGANVFDDECLSQRQLRDAVRGLQDGSAAESLELEASDLDLFLKDLDDCEQLFFCHDSAPELPFDAALIRELRVRRPQLQITCVVRAAPILLDATREDVEHHGIPDLDGVVAVIDPGIPALGLPVNECPREFRDHFAAAELVLAKGQAHYETLADGDKLSYFLLRVKCEVMARHQGVSVGDVLFLKA